MPSFAYTAVDQSGVLASGAIDAKTRTEAYRALMSKKLSPLEITPSGENAAGDSPSAPVGRVTARLGAKHVLQFTEELADLHKAVTLAMGRAASLTRPF